MSEQLQIVCQQCNAINRLPTEKLDDHGNCGRCKEPLFSGTTLDLTAENFDRNVQKNDIPLVVDCWAEWCGPCKSFGPIFQQATEELEPGARFAKLDTEANRPIGEKLQIRSIPTLLIFKGGEEIARQSGALPLEQFKAWVEARI